MHAQVTLRLDARYIGPAAMGHVRYCTTAWLCSPESSHWKSEDDTGQTSAFLQGMADPNPEVHFRRQKILQFSGVFLRI